MNFWTLDERNRRSHPWHSNQVVTSLQRSWFVSTMAFLAVNISQFSPGRVPSAVHIWTSSLWPSLDILAASLVIGHFRLGGELPSCSPWPTSPFASNGDRAIDARFSMPVSIDRYSRRIPRTEDIENIDQEQKEECIEQDRGHRPRQRSATGDFHCL